MNAKLDLIGVYVVDTIRDVYYLVVNGKKTQTVFFPHWPGRYYFTTTNPDTREWLRQKTS